MEGEGSGLNPDARYFFFFFGFRVIGWIDLERRRREEKRKRGGVKARVSVG